MTPSVLQNPKCEIEHTVLHPSNGEGKREREKDRKREKKRGGGRLRERMKRGQAHSLTYPTRYAYTYQFIQARCYIVAIAVAFLACHVWTSYNVVRRQSIFRQSDI